jgi:putative colanic acid biosynthesis acetyltransferase WcaF
MIYILLFRTTPTPLHAWRRLLLRLFGATVGRRVGVYPTTKIWAPWNLEIGDGATIGGGSSLYNVDKIRIGRAAVVSQGAHLCTASHDHNSEGFDLISAPIEISENAWVCAEAFVGPGVSLEEGAVAAARAVVVRSVDARKVVAGNPARIVSDRSNAAHNVLVGRAIWA